MRVTVVAEEGASELAQQVREAGHVATLSADGVVAPHEIDIVLVDGRGGDLGGAIVERVATVLACAPDVHILLLADTAAAALDIPGVAHVAVAPLAPGELATRLGVAERRAGRTRREDLLATAVEAAGDVIEITDADLTLLYVNPAYTATMGYAAEEAIGKTSKALVRSDMHDAEYFAEIDRTLARGEVWTGLIISKARDGRLVYLESTLAPVMDDHGIVLNYVGVKRDISARIETEQKLRRSNEELSTARDAALAASRAKSQFLANMSHELRTPLNAIIGYSEMLAEDAVELGEPAFIKDLSKIKTAGQHLLALINDVLDISKIEAGKMELFLESFDVADAVDVVVSTVQALFGDRGNVLDVEVGGDLGVMYADLTKLRQVLLNLLSNANKFTDKGRVTLRVHLEEEAVLFAVEDSGIGMTPEQQRRLFQPFVQADASTTRRYGGTGLGLAISQRFCELMGGAITHESELGEGSSFVVRLPREVGDPGGATAPRSVALDGAHRVLVIDDDRAVHDLLMRALGSRGLAVDCAVSGAVGLAMAREHRPDVIVLDVMMPGMDGWSVLSQLKADDATVDIPVVMLTMVDQSEVGYALGAVDYIVKPVDARRLARLLESHIEREGGYVLIVEDNAATREIMRRTLERAGHEVSEAVDGRAGLEALRTRRPDIVILDLMMPEVDGFEVLEQMQSDPKLREIPVIVATAKTLTAEERSRIERASQRIIQKAEYTRRELLELVNRRVIEALRHIREPARSVS